MKIKYEFTYFLFTISLAFTSCQYEPEVPPSYVVSDGTTLETYTKVKLDGDQFNRTTTFFTSIDLNDSTPISQVTSVTVVVHGLGYDYQNQFQSMFNSVYDVGAISRTLVVAPFFSNNSADNNIKWTGAVWRIGQNSDDGQSSFLLYEQFLKEYVLDGKFPNLKTVLLSGHSAGGQFSQRYAALNNLEEQYADITFKYMVSNPSSYLYINNQRYSDADEGFITPVASDCPEYNNYHYGLSNIQSFTDYRSDLDSTEIVNNDIKRLVTYATGTEDLDNSDESCSANWQGGGSSITNTSENSRHKRALYMQRFYDDQYPGNNHNLFEVKGIDHNAAGIYRSVEFMNWLSNNI
ncbi:hypothetical protein KMW28_15320 [Flammeovirga yaeyamensis]|uniref:Alpha/beta hydrolase n=1 Tax=Flammeovirga yaeyamensis TaxID=367791 RepID=A0AAX1N0J4_9BACT|nr:hypothetical protein [Flammeovirga yaeyamensis]MBB3698619.1 hypothetical protein [Flammeovirga yaeyamensis]NMF34033.1 hypothetical protein [Flammeovirga yaeyamensis]QWG01021.1 hypothetical protein KMW28_15320 [Flammeovirga yaeyamensis]